MKDNKIEEILKEFKMEFIQDNGDSAEDSFKDANGDGCRTVLWLEQALTEAYQQGKEDGIESCMHTKQNKVNQI